MHTNLENGGLHSWAFSIAPVPIQDQDPNLASDRQLLICPPDLWSLVEVQGRDGEPYNPVPGKDREALASFPGVFLPFFSAQSETDPRCFFLCLLSFSRVSCGVMFGCSGTELGVAGCSDAASRLLQEEKSRTLGSCLPAKPWGLC